MISDWPVYEVSHLQRLGYLLVEDGNHGEYRPRRDEFTDKGIAFIRAADMEIGRVLFKSASRINDVAFARIRKGVGAPGDVILSHKGTVGKVASVPLKCPKFVCSPQTTFWRTLDSDFLDRRFLYYFMCSPVFQRQLDVRKNETDMAGYVSLTNQRFLTLAIPPIVEQRAIAAILDSLDDKIELNCQMNATLEGIARAIFKSWFVDFDPVRANRGELDLSLSPDLLALFPDAFVESELGPIPAGWKVTSAFEEFDVTLGQSPPGSTYNEEGDGLPFYQGSADFSFRYPDHRVHCTDPKRLAKPNDTLLSVRAPVGDVNMALETCCIGRGLWAVRHKSGSRSYTFYATCDLKRYFERFNAEGTVFGSLSKRKFKNILVLSPPIQIVNSFEKWVAPLDDLIENNILESRTIADLRDTLLPKLISGELRVPDTMIEEKE